MKSTRALAFVALLLALPPLLAACSNSRTPVGGAPHPLGRNWILNHGAALGRYRCSDCHNLDTFCFRCHFGPTGSKVPPGVDWEHGIQAHARTDLWRYEATCLKCHEIMNYITGQPERLTCTGCHGHEMHRLPFFEQHPGAAMQNLLYCRVCHDTPSDVPNFNGFVTRVACADCHTAALAHPPPPDSIDWISAHQQAGNIPDACTICHALEGTSPLESATPCSACHTGGFGLAQPITVRGARAPRA